MTIEALRQQAAEAVAAAKARVTEQFEVIQLNATIARATSSAVLTATANIQAAEATSNKLRNLEAICEQTITSMPSYNSKTRENRKWMPTRQYGLGNQITALTGLLSGIQYAASVHKPYLLASTGLSEDLIESTLEALGATPYYSNNYGCIIEGSSYDLPKLLDNLQVIESILDITLDKSKLTDASLKARVDVAQLKAEKDQAAIEAAHALRQQAIAIA